ncbi:MAG TPA: FliH/SctL family protein [Legionella sp.]|nr:FliH/SctL family protein [Legionella sp.]
MAKLFKNACISSQLVHLDYLDDCSINTELPLKTQDSLSDAQLQEIKDKAYQEGYLLGKQEELKHHELVQEELITVLNSIPKAITQKRHEMNSEIADIILLITSHYFLERESNPQALELQINSILKQLYQQDNVVLSLHPKEVILLQQGNISLDTTHLDGLKIKSDDTLTLGGCVIKTNHGLFDASIEKQIERLKEMLLEIRQRGANVLPE